MYIDTGNMYYMTWDTETTILKSRISRYENISMHVFIYAYVYIKHTLKLVVARSSRRKKI